VNRAGSLPIDPIFDTRRWLVALMLLVAALALPGCGGDEQAKLEDYLEELEFDAPLESVKVVQLGDLHRISIAAHKQAYSDAEEEPVWVQLKFELFVEVAPEHEVAILAASERHRGMIGDIVVSICRNLTIEELDDHRRTTLKSRMLDALRPLLGENRIQKIILNNDSWEII
jgi:hypothetical protein